MPHSDTSPLLSWTFESADTARTSRAQRLRRPLLTYGLFLLRAEIFLPNIESFKDKLDFPDVLPSVELPGRMLILPMLSHLIGGERLLAERMRARDKARGRLGILFCGVHVMYSVDLS